LISFLPSFLTQVKKTGVRQKVRRRKGGRGGQGRKSRNKIKEGSHERKSRKEVKEGRKREREWRKRETNAMGASG
jgi:hypothetical protein